MQEILVYLIVGVAFGFSVRYLYRKWKILKRSTSRSACADCPLKKGCELKNSSCSDMPDSPCCS